MRPTVTAPSLFEIDTLAHILAHVVTQLRCCRRRAQLSLEIDLWCMATRRLSSQLHALYPPL